VASVQQAELIAVQLSLLANSTETHAPCLVNLSQDQAVTLINTVLRSVISTHHKSLSYLNKYYW
jgi:hypothetical protein